ncbi:MAG: endonuclease/exonuclease/phosphatase family protein [Bacteroidota bacterium]
MISWALGVIVVAGVIFVGGFFLFSLLTEFQPAPVEPVEVSGACDISMDSITEFSLITWNIGYGGLGREMDFFYDGGKRVRPGKSYFQQSCEGIYSFLQDVDSVDFFLLQEVDRNSKRSYYLDEVAWLATRLPGFCISFATNYDCRFVPVPVTQPMGRVVSGLVTCSRYQPVAVNRHGFDTRLPWPVRLFYLKRCFMVSRFNLPDGHQLVLINIHNSAYDNAGLLRKREMEMIRQFMLSEYEAGNYLVAGGDWNANPPGFEPEEIGTGDQVKRDEFTDLQTFFPEWEFAFDPLYPTNRNVNSAYQPGITPVTIIDFYLVSPNIRVLDVYTYPTGFEESDHQPVRLQIALRPSA